MGMNTSDLAGTMREAFTAGSGVDSSNLKLVLTIATVAFVAGFFAWLVTVTFENYRQGQIKQEEVMEACIKLLVVFCLIVWVVV